MFIYITYEISVGKMAWIRSKNSEEPDWIRNKQTNERTNELTKKLTDSETNQTTYLPTDWLTDWRINQPNYWRTN